MRPPLVTVVIAAWNAGRFIGRTLSSVRAQTLQDFEVIVVDDGSTDDTPAIVEAFAAADPRFRLVRQPNARVAAARNRGLTEARGRFLAPLDADDLWEPEYLERLVGALEAAGPQAVFAFARSVWIDAEDRLLPQSPIRFPRRLGYRGLLLRNLPGNASCAVYRTEAVRAVGGYDLGIVERHNTTEDWLLTLQLACRGEVVPVNAFLVRYRIHPASTSHVLSDAVGGLLEAVERMRRDGPAQPVHVYWRARSIAALSLWRRARRMGDTAMARRLFALAYLANPVWFLDPELRQPLGKLLPRRGGSVPQRVAGASAHLDPWAEKHANWPDDQRAALR